MAKTNSTTIPFLNILHTIPKDVPLEFIDEISKWSKIIKSPYGHSYYSDKVGWDYKEDGSLRIADHWNFHTHGKQHCQTTTNVSNNTHWTLAKYDKSIGKYVVISSIEKPKTSFRKSLEFIILEVEAKRKRGINTILKTLKSNFLINKAISDLDLKLLNYYFKKMEEIF